MKNTNHRNTVFGEPIIDYVTCNWYTAVVLTNVITFCAELWIVDELIKSSAEFVNIFVGL